MSAELRAEEITVRYGRAAAVSGASITARGGAVTAVVGPNGAGKSSLLMAVYGSVPAEGRVVVDGEDISRLSTLARARSGVALVPQGRRLFPRLSVRDNLRVMAESLRLPASCVDEALDRFPNLRERVRVPAGVLSGGEQQMLVVSRALMGSPRVLLLDEMMTGLAPRIVLELAQTVKDLAAEGVAVLIAEPSIGILGSTVTRGYVLVRGEVVATTEDGGAALERAYQANLGVGLEPASEAAAGDPVSVEQGGER